MGNKIYQKFAGYLVVLMSTTFLLVSICSFRCGDVSGGMSVHQPDTVLLYPGFFQWDENTVLRPEGILHQNILRYQEMLDHTNTDFSDTPRTSILLTIDSVRLNDRKFMIEITRDTIQVSAFSLQNMDAALNQLLQLKNEAKMNSPDYGLIYIRCGMYRYENF